MSNALFACAINCMDGRTQEPVIKYLKKRLGVDYVDAVTEPGPIKLLADNDVPWVENIKACCDISVNKHGAGAVAIVSHYDCAGNPQPRAVQLKQLQASVELVRGWYPDVLVCGLWVDEKWEVEEVITCVPENQ